MLQAPLDHPGFSLSLSARHIFAKQEIFQAAGRRAVCVASGGILRFASDGRHSFEALAPASLRGSAGPQMKASPHPASAPGHHQRDLSHIPVKMQNVTSLLEAADQYIDTHSHQRQSRPTDATTIWTQEPMPTRRSRLLEIVLRSTVSPIKCKQSLGMHPVSRLVTGNSTR